MAQDGVHVGGVDAPADERFTDLHRLLRRLPRR
jgi:hypothetical protein